MLRGISSEMNDPCKAAADCKAAVELILQLER